MNSSPLPVSFVLDDPAPLLNLLYHIEIQVRHSKDPRQKSGEPVVEAVPLELLQSLSSLIRSSGARGKFSLVPFPAGLGNILDGWEGVPKREIDAWLRIAREEIEPQMDIAPEMLTHTRAVDLAAGSLLPESERDWSQRQDASTLTPYLALALDTLRKAGFDAKGVSSPWDFGAQVEGEYAKAVLAAQRQVYGRSHTWFVLGCEGLAGRSSYVALRDGEGGCVVRVISKVGDLLWQTMESQESSQAYVSSIADQYIDAKAEKGALVELFNARVPMLFVTHWQSLFSNGRYSGLRALALVLERIEARWGAKVQWMKCSEFAATLAASDGIGTEGAASCP